MKKQYRKRVIRRIRRKFRIAVIGGGSWGTALVKILQENTSDINWYIRNPDHIEFIKKYKKNPKYLTHTKIETNKTNFYSDINLIVKHSDVLIFAVPSAFLKSTLSSLTINLTNKFIVSAIKGIIPEDQLTITKYFHQHHNVPFTSMAVISGPSHAEEIALERLTYLSIASKRIGKIKKIANKLECDYIKTVVSKDVFGIEYAGILKNIIAIASGICHGVGYGDNFQAVLISNAIREINRFLRKVSKAKRQIDRSVYLGDLMVTSYSQFSRNRTLGNMIGKGYSVKSASIEMNMIAEGYYALECIKLVIDEKNINMPIVQAVYNIIFRGREPEEEMKSLAKNLH